MKKLILTFAVLGLLVSACTNTKQYKLTGNIEGMPEGKAYLSKLENNDLVKIDSVDIKEGSFEFVGTVDAPDIYFIELKGQRAPIQVFLENSEITVNANVENLREAKVAGSQNQAVYDAFVASQKDFQEQQKALYQEYRKAKEANNETAVDSIEGVYDKLEEQKMEASEEFIKKNSNSVAAGFVAFRVSYNSDAEKLEEIYNLLGEEVKKSSYAVRIKEKAELLKKVAIGQPAPDFTLNTPEGTPLSLSSLKGKVVVIDFWASWCGPCRRENPNMVKLYKEVHEKGVEFLGVSLDKEKDKWLKAIEDDKLEWKHVSDLKFWDSEAAKLYGISGIPATVVIDQEGKIAAKKVFGDELKAEIDKLIQ